MKRNKKEIVSYKMSRIRAKNTGIEKCLSSVLTKNDISGYRKNVRGVLGTPDFCWKGKKIAVFCDSSFWHGYDWKHQIKTIKTRKKFWIAKIEANIARDRSIDRQLRKSGWKVLRFWDFAIKKDMDNCISEIKKLLSPGQAIKTLRHKQN